MSQLILLALVVGIAALWLSPELRQRLRRDLPRWLPWIGVAVLALLVATGRLHWLLAVAGGAIPFLQRGFARLADGGRAPMETRYLKIEPGDGETPLDGEIKAGEFAGRRLSELGQDEISRLHAELGRRDAAAQRLLEAYLDHTQGAAWRQGRETPRGGGEMSRDEAYAILGLAPGAEESAIVAAHRRLMQRLHPDRGGSDYLAARINEAKRLLLGERG
ncbi:molecular chaperone DnaJ [Ectothiorhodospiraceae bacterium WFHF3C12]|nr:molecular chaperone DnaJ [Ectothiorhodospiraceae bacterium WFHF3C12]